MKLFLFAFLLASAAYGQCGRFAVNPVTGKLDCIGTGVGTANIQANIAGPSTTSGSIDVTALALTTPTLNSVAVQCWSGTGFASSKVTGTLTALPCTITTRTTSAFAVTYSSTANVLVILNASGGAGATGTTGATGSTGATGAAGSNGTNGTNGLSLLNGTGAPSSGTGVNGEYYIDNSVNCIYGPKAAGAWPGSCTSLAGGSVVKGLGYTFYNSGGLTSGQTGYLRIPAACTITNWSISADAGTATIKLWKKVSGTALPTVSDSISTSGVAISTGTNVTSSTVSDFTTTTVLADDLVAVNLFAVSGANFVNFTLGCTGPAGGGGGGGVTLPSTTNLFKGDGVGGASAATPGTDYSKPATTETTSGGRTFTGVLDASGGSRTAPVKVGTSLPGTCTVGDVYYKSDASAGSNLYFCTSSNTWTQMAGASSLTAGTGISITSNVASVDITVVPQFLTGTASLSFGTVTASRTADLTFTLTGASTGDACIAGAPNTIEAGILTTCFVSATNTITVRVAALAASNVAMAAGQTFRATIVRSF